MGLHDRYGKDVVRRAAAGTFTDYGKDLFVPYGSTGGATVDGVIGNSIVVEIEARVSKQVRGALLDLILHPYPKKLLVLMPVHMANPALCMEQCIDILGRLCAPENNRVIVLAGSGHRPMLACDTERLKAAIDDLIAA